MKKKLLYLYFLILILPGCKAQQTQDFKINTNNNTLLWKVSGNGLAKPGFLFGTFHLLCKDDIHFSEQLKSALQYADDVYMELDMDDPSTLMSGLLFMNMNNGTILKDLYKPEEYKKIESYFTDSLNMPFQMFKKVKPYFLIAMLYPKMMKCKTFSGVEEELMKLAKENRKEISGLETIQFQSSVFDTIPYELQSKELLRNIDSLDKYKDEFDTMALVYKNQQLDAMEKLFTKSEEGMEAYQDVLLYRRNADWVNKLDTIMKTKSVFVAVGAAHLLGDKGLIELLRKKGYKVDPLVNH